MMPPYKMAASASNNQNILGLNLDAIVVCGLRCLQFVQTLVVVVPIVVVGLVENVLALIEHYAEETILRHRLE